MSAPSSPGTPPTPDSPNGTAGPAMPAAGRPGGHGQVADPYAVMRPKWGRRVAQVAALVILVAAALGAILVPGPERQKGEWGLADRGLLLGSGVLIAGFLWRFASIRAVPSREGLLVRNLFLTRRLAWAEIVRVQFGGGAPWASLDLDDTDTLAVMAIQKADGPHGRALASRLAALIQVHSRTDEPPHPGHPG